MLGLTFLGLWFINVFIYLKLRKAIRNESLEDFNNVFGFNEPIQKQLNVLRIAFNKDLWGAFNNPGTIKLLRLHWASAIAFYGYGVVVVLYFIVSGVCK